MSVTHHDDIGVELIYKDANSRLEASAQGNALVGMPLCIARLDKLSWDECVGEWAYAPFWDLRV